MRKRSKPSLQRSLLSYAIAAAAAGMMPGAYAVDLCTGNATTTISTNAADNTCTLDTAGAVLTITATGAISNQISVNVSNAVVNNAGTITESVSNSTWTAAYGISAGNLGTGGAISNSGTITVSGVSTDSQASANGIRVHNMTGGATVTNSGTVSAIANGVDWAGAYAVGSWASQIDNSAIVNTATGVINATATVDTNYYATAYGLFAPQLINNALLSNAGTINATATGAGTAAASAYGIYQYDSSYDSAIRNTGTITATATATGDEWAGAWAIEAGGHRFGSSVVSNSGTLNATASGRTATAYGIQVSAELRDSATLTNSGTVNATASADSWAQAYALSVDGLRDAAAIVNSGTLTARATSLDSSASAWGIFTGGHFAGSVTNSGNINVAVTATAEGEWAGAYGIGNWWWVSSNGLSIANTATGSITATATGDRGSAYGIAASGYLTDASISNAGTITATTTGGDASYASAWGIYAGYLTDSTVTNSGRITASATAGEEWAGAWGIYAASLSGESVLSNTGTINASIATDSYGSVYGMQIDGVYNDSVVNNSGVISATGSAATWMSAYGIYAGNLQNSASVINSGTITATAVSHESSASANGIRVRYVQAGTSVSNSGSIAATATATADGQWAGAYGMGSWDWQAPNGFDLTNSGSITATATGDRGSAYGMFLSGWGSNDLWYSNSGTITATTTGGNASYASAYGMYYYGESYTNTFLNSGSITATASGAGSDTWVGAYGIKLNSNLFEDGVLQIGSVIDNAGTIVARATSLGDSASAYGISAWGLYDGSSVSNSGTIAATAQGTNWVGAYGIYLGHMDGGTSVTNSGTIGVAATVGESGTGSAYGIYVSTLSSGASLTNSGSIAAAGGDGIDFRGIYVSGGGGDVINSGSILGGVYLGGTVSMLNDGNLTLAAGQTSYIGGDYEQGADGRLTTTVRGAADYGQLNVNGTADFGNGGRLVVALDPTVQLTSGTVLADVVSAGTLVAPAGDFDIVDSSLFWNFTNVGNATTVDLLATQVDAASVLAGSGALLTPSQLALINGSVNGSIGAQYAALSGALNNAPSAAAVAAIVAQLSPAAAGAAGRVALAASSSLGTLIDARQSETGAASGDAFTANGVWLKTLIGSAEQDAVGGVNGFDADTTGFVLGVDGNVSDSWRLGVAVAAAQTDVDAAFSSLDIDTLQFTVYGRYAVTDATSLDLDVNHVANSVDSRRFVGFVNSTAVAGYDGSQFALGASLTHRASVADNVALLPGVSVRYRQVKLDGYTETGAGAFDLTVDGRSDSALLWQAKLGLEVGLGGYGTLLANAGVGYDTLDAASATATLSGNGPTFISQGVKPESTVLNAGVGYRYVTAKGLEINALYELEDRDTFNADTASLKFRLPF